MGSAIASPSTTPVAFVGRPHGPPRCKSAPLYHRAQVARPISQGLQGGETPFCAQLHPVAPPCARLRLVAPGCARLRPVVPGCARLHPLAPGCAWLCRPVPSRTILHHPAPSHPAPFAAQPRRTPSPFAPQRHRTPAPSHPGPFTLQSLRAPAPSHPGPFALLHRHTPALRVTSSIVATAFPDGISLESPLSYSLTVFAEIAGNRPPANLSQPDASFFRVVRV